MSSPDEEMIAALRDQAMRITQEQIKLGGMEFTIEDAKTLQRNIPNGFRGVQVQSGTPIVVRIPKHRLKEYGISPTRDYDYVYWRKEFTLTPFVKQLEENLVKKYEEYSGKESDRAPVFEKLGFKKQVAVPLMMKGRNTTVIGTLWDFHFGPLGGQKRDMIQFGLDAGFGEMNSLGFGFMNLTGGN